MKTFLFLVFTAMASLNCFAQISGGVRVGLNYSNLIIDNVKYDYKPGYMVATYLKAFVYNKLSLQPEIQFTSIGYHVPWWNLNTTLNYFSMPAFFGYDINEVVNVYAGPQFSLLLSAREVQKQAGINSDIRGSYDIIDLGAAFGVGFNFSRCNFGLRYYRTLPVSLRPDEVNDPMSTLYYGAKNKYIQMTVGYRLSNQ